MSEQKSTSTADEKPAAAAEKKAAPSTEWEDSQNACPPQEREQAQQQ